MSLEGSQQNVREWEKEWKNTPRYAAPWVQKYNGGRRAGVVVALGIEEKTKQGSRQKDYLRRLRGWNEQDKRVT